MVKTSLTVVLEKLDTTKAQMARDLNMRPAWFTDFDKGRIDRIHLSVIQKIIDHYVWSKNVTLHFCDFFTDLDS